MKDYDKDFQQQKMKNRNWELCKSNMLLRNFS